MNCHDIRQGTITFAVLGLAVVLAGCGGSGKTTLQGTFSDRWDVDNQGPACADQLSATSITVAVDNVPAGNAPVTFSGNPANIGTDLGGQAVFACKGTWEINVPSAHVSYILGISGLTGNTGTVTIPADKAGGQIALDDYATNDQGTGGSLEISGGS